MAKPAEKLRNQIQITHPGATVHGRGRNWIRHQHPTDPNKFILDTSIGPIHYGPGQDQEINTTFVNADPVADAPWLRKMTTNDFHVFFGPGTQEFDAGQIIKYVHPPTAANVTFQAQSLQWTNDLDQIQQISAPAKIIPAINDDTLTFTGAYGTGLNFRWQVQTARLAKYLDIVSLASLPTPNATILAGGNPVLNLQFIFQKSAGVDIYIDGQLWNEAPNNPRTTSGNVEFRSGGQTLWWFKKAWATDQDGEAPNVVQRFRKQGPNLLVSVRVPWSWLQAAAYPVTVDPTIDPIVSASADDGAQNGASMDITGTQPRLGLITHLGHRFVLTGPASGDTIDVAYQTTNQPASFADEVDDVDLYCQATDNAAAFTTTDNDISNRTSTSAVVTWNPDPIDIGTGDQNGPSLVSPIQEVINRAGWSSGNGLALIMIQTPATSGTDWRVRHYDGSTTECPRLHIEYTAAGAGALTISVTDAVTVGEARTISVTRQVDRSDSVTTGEIVALSVQAATPRSVNVTDAVTVGEVRSLTRSDAQISRTDSVTVGEIITLSIVTRASVVDAVTVAESVTVRRTSFVSVIDAVTTGEAVTLATSAPQVSVTDAVTVGEITSLTVSDPQVIVTDAVTVGEDVTVDVGAIGEVSVSVVDAITVAETTSLVTSDPQVSVTDAVTIGEAVTLATDDLTLSVTDAVTVAEDITVSVAAFGALTVSVTDAVTVGEVVTIDPLLILMTVVDLVSVGEIKTVRSGVLKLNSDNVLYARFRDKRAPMKFRDKRALGE